MKRFVLILILLLGSEIITLALDPKGSTFSHDPATLIKDGDTYWHFFTAPGIGAASSKDMVNWSSSDNHIFQPGPLWKNNYPEWTITYFGSGESANTDGNLWAPDIIHMNGAYYLYYSCSSFGVPRSAIGVVKSTSLNNPDWVDLGKVVSSSTSSDVNAIDPGMFRDDDGKVYMVYGSYSAGIGIVEIDTVSGLATSAAKILAGGGGSTYEAPALFKEDGYYYLTINNGSCCQGLESTYYIIVGRSTAVNGPYGGFRTLLPNRDGKYIGPGHFSLYRDECANYVTTHYYDGSANGFPRYDILRMQMVDGWPALYRNFSVDNCDDPITVVTSTDNTEMETILINLYPNPVRNVLNIDLPAKLDTNSRLTIYDITGQIIYSRIVLDQKVISLDLSTLNKGIYCIVVSDYQVRTVQKIVKL